MSSKTTESSTDMNKDESRAIIPNPQFMTHLLQLKIPKETAEKALTMTKNESLVKATILARDLDMADDQNWEDIPGYKMVFAVNTSLRMGVGKTAEKVAEAALRLMDQLLKLQTNEEKIETKLRDWKDGGSKKIVLNGGYVDELIRLKRKTKKFNVPHVTIRNSDKLEAVEPGGQMSVFGLFGGDALLGMLTSKLPSL